MFRVSRALSAGFICVAIQSGAMAQGKSEPLAEKRKIGPPALDIIKPPPISIKEAMERVAKPTAKASNIPFGLLSAQRGEPIEPLPITPRSGRELPESPVTPSGLKRAEFALRKAEPQQKAASEALQQTIPAPAASARQAPAGHEPATFDLPFSSK